MAEKTGTRTTFKPVINPEFDAVVYFKPVTCSAIPANSVRPVKMPHLIEVRLISFNRLKKSRQIMTDASKNLIARYVKAGV